MNSTLHYRPKKRVVARIPFDRQSHGTFEGASVADVFMAGAGWLKDPQWHSEKLCHRGLRATAARLAPVGARPCPTIAPAPLALLQIMCEYVEVRGIRMTPTKPDLPQGTLDLLILKVAALGPV